VTSQAVQELGRLGARGEIEALLPLLEAPPVVTWAIHLALLEACKKVGLAAPAGEVLREADNADVQAAMASLGP
jgi:hypothetical protein